MNDLNWNNYFLSLQNEFNSENEMIEAIAKNPLDLICLFDFVTNEQNHWHLTKKDSFKYLSNKIAELSSAANLDAVLIEKIMLIGTKIYKKLDDEPKAENLSFFNKHLNSNNIYSFLKIASENNDPLLMDYCFNFLKKQKGLELFFTEDSTLSIKAINPQFSQNNFLSDISSLSEIFQNKINITLILSGYLNLENIQFVKDFIKSYGYFVDKLSLSLDINDECVVEIIKYLPNVYYLLLNSKNIKGECLKDLTPLKNLKHLIVWCRELEILPKLPVDLKSFEFMDNWVLTEMPDVLPKGLLSFKISGGITSIPHPLPNELLNCDVNCVNMKDDHRLEILSSLLDRDFAQGIKFSLYLGIKDSKKLKSLILKKSTIELLIEHLSEIKAIALKMPSSASKKKKYPKQFIPFVIKIINENFDYFIDNLGDFSLKYIPHDTFNPFQTVEIMIEACKIYELLSEKKRNEILYFFTHHLNDDNVYSCLTYAREEAVTDLRLICLEYIQVNTGIIIKDLIGSPLLISINEPKISFDELSFHINSLSRIYHRHIEIKLNLDNPTLKDLENFLINHGHFIKSLTLDGIDDNFLENLINYVPNLVRVNIRSEKIKNRGLTHLKNLNELKKLSICCKNLSQLPNILPFKLEILYLGICYNLTSDSINLPNSLKVLTLHYCTKLRVLPILPEGLISLDVRFCKNLVSISELPQSLEFIDFLNCDSLKVDELLRVLSSLLDLNFAKGVEIAAQLNIRDFVKLSKLIFEKATLEHIVKHFLDIQMAVGSEEMSPFMIKIFKEDFNHFIENLELFSLADMPQEIFENEPNWKKLSSCAINKRSLSNKINNDMSLELDDIPGIEIDELLTLFEAINFTDKTSPGFIDSSKLNLDGEPTRIQTLRKGMKLLLKYIAKQENHLGVPKDDHERIQWYKKLEIALKHVIKLANESSELTTVNNEISNIGAVGYRCGSRWMKESSDAIKNLKDNITPDIEGINELIYSWLEGYIQGIVEQMILEYSEVVGRSLQPHLFNYIAKVMIGEGFSLSNMIVDIDDVFIPDLIKQIPHDEIKERINTYFIPINLAKFIRNQIHDLLKIKPAFGDLILIPFQEYAERKLEPKIKEIYHSLEKKQLINGIIKVNSLLNENRILDAILNDNKIELELINRTDRMTLVRLSQVIKGLEQEEKLTKMEEVALNLNYYKSLLENREEFKEDIKTLGNLVANNQIRFEIDELVNEYLESENLVRVNLDTYEVKVTLIGALKLLEHLQFLYKINI